MVVISVIVGSIRQARFAEKPAHWIFQYLKTRATVDARLLDLRDFPLPFFDHPMLPGSAWSEPQGGGFRQLWQ